MTNSSFDMNLDDMPDEIAIFPLKEVILFPRRTLPLNIFEPRYIQMIEDCFANQRIIGIIQPKSGAQHDNDAPNAVFTTGCAGRITNLSETKDGRYLVDLKGICRFNIIKERPQTKLYRQVFVDWMPHAQDFQSEPDGAINRDDIIPTLQQYLHKMGMFCDRWDEVHTSTEEKLISCLSMICPLPANEKQALLEAEDLKKRAELLKTFLQMALIEQEQQQQGH